jgi:phosphoribosyl-ATP pyrophosphohydrolase/phosphoribosyl-AMP cyclohydrolase
MAMNDDLTAHIDFAKGDGLVPAIVQDAANGAVLMLGYMNAEALAATHARGRVVFFSRSRGRLWEKGETSGHTLELVDVRVDCDGDTLLVTARPNGPACHLGTRTCFGDDPVAPLEPLGFLSTLERIVEERIADRPEGSYTARLHAAGPRRMAQKVGEEGLEVALAAAAESDEKVLGESADLLFHLVVLLKSRGLTLEAVVRELAQRHVGAPVRPGGL